MVCRKWDRWQNSWDRGEKFIEFPKRLFFLHVIWVHVTLYTTPHAESVIIFLQHFFLFDIPLMFQSFFINFVAASVVHAFERIKKKFKALYSRLSLTPPRHSISDLRHTCMDEIISFFSVAAVEIVAVDCVAYVYGGNFWHARCCRWTFWKFYEITALNY